MIFLLTGFIYQFTFGQSVDIECPENVEIGIPATFTATFDDEGVSGIEVLRYEWRISFNGDGVGGISGIIGNTNGETSFTDPLIIESDENSNSITVTWGDFFDPCMDEVTVNVFYEINGQEQDPIPATCQVDIFCIQTPFITGPTSIQECCRDIVTFCDDSGGNQDTWTWTVAGGTIVSGQGTQCIDVRPNNTGNLTVATVVGRSTGLTSYTRTSTTTTTRFQAETSDITGPSYTCGDESIKLCVDDICGMTGVDWFVPNSFSVLSGQGTNCIIIKPNASVGTVANITATSTLLGGCIATTSSHSISIFSSEVPPCPEGYPIIIFEDDYDPCDHEGTSYTFDFITNNPYLNGITTITPGVVIDVPHHNVGDRISVTVCNTNLCSGKKCCKRFLLYLPPPCEKDDPFKPLVYKSNNESQRQLIQFRDTKEKDLNDTYINVFPNPTTELFTLISNTELNGELTIYDIHGSIVGQRSLNGTTDLEVDVSNISSSGIYYLVVKNGDDVHTHSIIISK